jgi:hypothetical protein
LNTLPAAFFEHDASCIATMHCHPQNSRRQIRLISCSRHNHHAQTERAKFGGIFLLPHPSFTEPQLIYDLPVNVYIEN